MTITALFLGGRDRVRSWPAWVPDGALAAVFVVSGILSVTGTEELGGTVYEPVGALAWGLILLSTLPLVVRRRAPLTVFVITLAAIVTEVLLGYFEGTLPLVVIVTSYTVGAHCPPRRIAAAVLAMATGLLALMLGGAPRFGVADLAGNAALFVGAGAVGWAIASRRQRIEALEDRAEALERERREVASRAVADERLRIAQELHDVVAHSMSVIAVQAGAGLQVVRNDPEEAERSLANISATSRSTLGELRRLLGVLREEQGGADYLPSPGLGGLERLAHEVTDAGVPVTVSVDGELGDLPPVVDLTAYRLVQEALTNVLKHAGPASATVQVTREGGRLRIEVTDDGRGTAARPSATSGHGLVGMRERVAVFGGSLDAGPRAAGGYRVAADLPYDLHGAEVAR